MRLHLAFSLALLATSSVGCSVSEPEADRTVELPFLVSEEFTPSGFMGDGELDDVVTMEVDNDKCHVRAADSRGSCFRFDYHAPASGSIGWGGVYFQAPPNNWGDLPGKRVAQGAKQLRLKAAGLTGTELATFTMAGLTGTDANGDPYPNADTFKGTKSFSLTTDFVEYVVPVPANATYDRVLGAFAWSLLAPADHSPVAIFLDDIRWE